VTDRIEIATANLGF